MGAAYYLRPELEPFCCIVDRCSLRPTRWSCLCEAHYIRWYKNGSFEKRKVDLRREHEMRLWARATISRAQPVPPQQPAY